MSINTIENCIISQLQENIPDLKIEGFPEKPQKYDLIHPKGAVLVHFKGSQYENPIENYGLQQIVNMNFSLTLVIKGPRDKDGAYQYIDKIISVLTGYKPTGCGKMYPNSTEFLSEIEGLWRYNLEFSVPTENFST